MASTLVVAGSGRRFVCRPFGVASTVGILAVCFRAGFPDLFFLLGGGLLRCSVPAARSLARRFGLLPIGAGEPKCHLVHDHTIRVYPSVGGVKRTVGGTGPSRASTSSVAWGRLASLGNGIR